MSKHDNPPLLALPNYIGEDCVTLRDLFAAFSLAGMRASPDGYMADPAKIAEYAYKDADAMLAERAKVAE